MGTKIKNFFMSMLSEDSKVSSKRVIAFVGFLVLLLTMIITTFTPLDKKPDANLIATIELIILVALGSSSVEKFKKTNNTVEDKGSLE
jgi:predicted permease